ncbi:MAG: hypothetical protein IPO08_22430 [Xanthomonadales bacterium]|nr:hypothetical protein [Xanthomonadales bacterium]
MTMRTLGSDGKYWPTAVQVVERIAELTQRAEDAEASATTAERERDEAREELERVKAERDEAQEHLVYLFDHLKIWLGARLIGEVEP